MELNVWKESDKVNNTRFNSSSREGRCTEITIDLEDDEKKAAAAAAFAHSVYDAILEEHQGIKNKSLVWQRHWSYLLDSWQAQEQFNGTEVRTLRQMVIQRHNLLERAYEVFAGDGNESELLDTCQRVARLQQKIQQWQTNKDRPGASCNGLSLEIWYERSSDVV
ncbi:hypothetical protein PsorP6_019359 [Peronosclerospora sorghi]|nr:hypothetical protein PsorP6_019359 [Peronosclerospora sorghi]